ncbi:MAG: FadR family transcriptional regulator [Alphaproteobacteria bacterium]|nr:FadR family transcriptional regulator [Alphaproteobacteria bacterium]
MTTSTPTNAPTPDFVEPAVRLVVRRLRAEILAQPEGASLGAEQELLQRLGVSRPTLRQAARVLEYQQLLVVRTGVRGGYYVRRPNIESVASAAALYLRLRGTCFDDLLATSFTLSTEAYRLAATSKRDREALKRVLERMRQDGDAQSDASGEVMSHNEQEMLDAVLALAASPPLELFLRTLYAFGLNEISIRAFQGHPRRIREWRKSSLALGESILSGDAEGVIAIATRRSRQIRGWVSEEPKPADTLPKFLEEAI